MEVPRVAFLGIAEKAIATNHIGPFTRTNIIGVSNLVAAVIYPFDFGAFTLVLALYDPQSLPAVKVVLRAPSGLPVAYADFAVTRTPIPAGIHTENPPGTSSTEQEMQMALPGKGPGWVPFLFGFRDSSPTIAEPGSYELIASYGGRDYRLGEIVFVVPEIPPLSAERIAGLRAQPGAAKRVIHVLGCKKCDARIRTYAGLSRDAATEETGSVWYEDLPDYFKCHCGATNLPLLYIRRNLHALLDQRFRPEDESAVQAYNREALHRTHKAFSALLDKDGSEEDIQRFLAANPILLHFLAPESILIKTPILARYRTDFTLVTTKRELLLVEIERPGTRLLRKDGGRSSELQHAADQVRDWLHVVDEHRIAVLTEIGIPPTRIGSVRGVVIAGREEPYDDDSLRKIKAAELSSRVSLFTYDDVLRSMSVLLRSLDRL